MFKVNLQENELVPLKRRAFGELNLRERPHLQEWIARTPSALGEELLIIQKEFAGFEDTRERLDLLALDKEGRLVVIENKLDDSGRDVVWQALKYVAYCSSLKKAEILDIYQRYLDRCHKGGDSADARLRDFLGVEDLDGAVLNAGNDQRLVLVAARFRKEVTATVLWLIGHGVRVECFQAAPYSLGEELLLDLRQIIPTPEASDYMIRVAVKESEERSDKSAEERRRELRREFWSRALEKLRDRNVSRYERISPSRDHWLASATGVRSCSYQLIFAKKEARVELVLARPEAEENKWFFDQLGERKGEIEEHFGAKLQWLRLDENKQSRICHAKAFDGYDKENWPEMIDWLSRHFVAFERAFSEPLTDLSRQLKAPSGISAGGQGDSP